MFREWHKRLEARSENIVKSIMSCHVRYLAGILETEDGMNKKMEVKFERRILTVCSDSGYQAANTDEASIRISDESKHSEETEYNPTSMEEKQIILELRSHLHQAFGHPIRLDYGTGHVSSFFIFLYCICKLRMFGNIRSPDHSSLTPPSPNVMAPVALSIVTQYLNICRGLQSDYMLEPAGSHGVWGLDDYHCIPFYIGACQLQQSGEVDFEPASIHDDDALLSGKDVFMYFACIHHIKSLKKGVPFFESSPMLDDISHLKDWGKISSGLLRLYEGEVLDQMPVVQHFLFSELFKGDTVVH